MTSTALIGSSCKLGQLWSSNRYYDYLFAPENWELLRGKEFGEVVLIDPILWEGPEKAKADPSAVVALIDKLEHLLHDVKIERLTYLTTVDLLPPDGDEESPLLAESSDPCLAAQIALGEFLNLRFGRVLTIRLPQLLGLGEGFSVVDNARVVEEPLLKKHQFYPVQRLMRDVDLAWQCGLFTAVLASEPVTTFEIAEKVFPELQDKLPIAHPSDPLGSDRKSRVAYLWHDPMTGYVMERDDLWAEIKLAAGKQ